MGASLRTAVPACAIPLLGASVVLAVLTVAVGCGTESDSDDRVPRARGESPSSSVSDEPTDAASGCLEAQQRAVRKGPRIHLLHPSVRSRADARQDARWLRRDVVQRSRRIAESCDGAVPAEVEALGRAVLAAAADLRTGRQDAGPVLDAWKDWAVAVGLSPEKVPAIQEHETCRRIQSRVDATYVTTWRDDGGDRIWNITLRWRNRLARRIFVDIGGDARADGYVGATDDFAGGGPQISWGGSSADVGNQPVGRSTMSVGLVPPEVRTTADGSLEVLSFYAWVYHGDAGCYVPLSPGTDE